MAKRMNNKGLTLVELIVAITIMAVLVGVMSPMLVKYIERAKQVKVEKEASEFVEAARIAYIEVCSQGNAPSNDVIKHKASKSSRYYKDGTLYGNLTNWTVHNGTVAGASNGPFAAEIFDILGITMGSKWKSGNTTIPISSSQPKLNQCGSTTKECIFQLFYNQNGDMVVEYSRNGYFVRMENSVLVDSIKIKRSDKLFTVWQ